MIVVEESGEGQAVVYQRGPAYLLASIGPWLVAIGVIIIPTAFWRVATWCGMHEDTAVGIGFMTMLFGGLAAYLGRAARQKFAS